MNEKELLEQIAAMVAESDHKNSERFDRVEQRLDDHDKRYDKVDERFDRMMSDIAGMFERQMQAIIDSETRINIKIENEIGKKIDALFDGYKLNFERHEELKDRVDSLEERVDRLETAV